MIEKAKKGNLRGWSFGFEAVKEYAEAIKDGLKRRFIEDMNLFEISIIDERKIPCYVGTSIGAKCCASCGRCSSASSRKKQEEFRCDSEKGDYVFDRATRANKKIEFRGENFQAKILDYQQKPKIDYSEYEAILADIVRN